MRFCILPRFITRKDHRIHIGGRNMKIIRQRFETVSVFVGLRPVTKKIASPRRTCISISWRATSFGMLNSSQPLFIFPRTQDFSDNLRFLARRFLPRQKPGLEKVPCHRYQTHRHWRTPCEAIFNLCDRNPMNWCLFSKPGKR